MSVHMMEKLFKNCGFMMLKKWKMAWHSSGGDYILIRCMVHI